MLCVIYCIYKGGKYFTYFLTWPGKPWCFDSPISPFKGISKPSHASSTKKGFDHTCSLFSLVFFLWIIVKGFFLLHFCIWPVHVHTAGLPGLVNKSHVDPQVAHSFRLDFPSLSYCQVRDLKSLEYRLWETFLHFLLVFTFSGVHIGTCEKIALYEHNSFSDARLSKQDLLAIRFYWPS